jgi:hypothetical protein
VLSTCSDLAEGIWTICGFGYDYEIERESDVLDCVGENRLGSFSSEKISDQQNAPQGLQG